MAANSGAAGAAAPVAANNSFAAAAGANGTAGAANAAARDTAIGHSASLPPSAPATAAASAASAAAVAPAAAAAGVKRKRSDAADAAPGSAVATASAGDGSAAKRARTDGAAAAAAAAAAAGEAKNQAAAAAAADGAGAGADADADAAESKPDIRCRVCDSTFTRRSTLNAHMRRHTGAGLWACTYPGCDRAFPTASAMKRHRTTHAGGGGGKIRKTREFERIGPAAAGAPAVAAAAGVTNGAHAHAAASDSDGHSSASASPAAEARARPAAAAAAAAVADHGRVSSSPATAAVVTAPPEQTALPPPPPPAPAAAAAASAPAVGSAPAATAPPASTSATAASAASGTRAGLDLVCVAYLDGRCTQPECEWLHVPQHALPLAPADYRRYIEPLTVLSPAGTAVAFVPRDVRTPSAFTYAMGVAAAMRQVETGAHAHAQPLPPLPPLPQAQAQPPPRPQPQPGRAVTQATQQPVGGGDGPLEAICVQHLDGACPRRAQCEWKHLYPLPGADFRRALKPMALRTGAVIAYVPKALIPAHVQVVTGGQPAAALAGASAASAAAAAGAADFKPSPSSAFGQKRESQLPTRPPQPMANGSAAAVSSSAPVMNGVHHNGVQMNGTAAASTVAAVPAAAVAVSAAEAAAFEAVDGVAPPGMSDDDSDAVYAMRPAYDDGSPEHSPYRPPATAGAGGTGSAARPFACLQCGKRYANSGVLMRHARSHADAFVSCHACPTWFLNPARYREHLKLHGGAGRFACADCSLRVNDEQLLARHRLVAHDPGRRELRQNHRVNGVARTAGFPPLSAAAAAIAASMSTATAEVDGDAAAESAWALPGTIPIALVSADLQRQAQRDELDPAVLLNGKLLGSSSVSESDGERASDVSAPSRSRTRSPVAERKRRVLRCGHRDCAYASTSADHLKTHYTRAHKSRKPTPKAASGGGAKSPRPPVPSRSGKTKRSIAAAAGVAGVPEYLCRKCNITFASTGSLNRHMQYHGGPGKTRCPHCDYRTNQRSEITKHIGVAHPDKPQTLLDPAKSKRRKAATAKARAARKSGAARPSDTESDAPSDDDAESGHSDATHSDTDSDGSSDGDDQSNGGSSSAAESSRVSESDAEESGSESAADSDGDGDGSDGSSEDVQMQTQTQTHARRAKPHGPAPVNHRHQERAASGKFKPKSAPATAAAAATAKAGSKSPKPQGTPKGPATAKAATPKAAAKAAAKSPAVKPGVKPERAAAAAAGAAANGSKPAAAIAPRIAGVKLPTTRRAVAEDDVGDSAVVVASSADAEAARAAGRVTQANELARLNRGWHACQYCGKEFPYRHAAKAHAIRCPMRPDDAPPPSPPQARRKSVTPGAAEPAIGAAAAGAAAQPAANAAASAAAHSSA